MRVSGRATPVARRTPPRRGLVPSNGPRVCNEIEREQGGPINQPVTLPGVTLPAGKYLFRNPDINTSRRWRATATRSFDHCVTSDLRDVVRLKTPAQDLEYRVRETFIIDPEDVWVLKSTPATMWTLITCYPFDFVGSAPRRFIVRAERIDVPQQRSIWDSTHGKGSESCDRHLIAKSH